MARILILHAALGTGHISAANALDEAFRRLQVAHVRTEDTLTFASPLLRGLLTQSYMHISEKAPQLYKMLYAGSDTADMEDMLSGNKLMGMLESPFLNNLERLVTEEAPDAIICVHPLPAQVLQLREMKGRLPQPNYVVVTDFMAHSTWINFGVDGYFLPFDLTRMALITRGVPAELLHVTGIPIKPTIADPKPRDQMRVRHQLPPDLPVVTLFGGGLDPERVRWFVTTLLDIKIAGMLLVVAGRNKYLVDALSDLSSGSHMQLRVLGLIDFVDDLVVASDLVVTKAGGLIVSEILARGTPMVIIDPIPGQEEWNADIISAAGAGVQLRMSELAPVAVLALLTQPERLQAMRLQTQSLGHPRAALDIAEHVLADLEKR